MKVASVRERGLGTERAHLSVGVKVRRIGDRVRMRLEWSCANEVEEVVLSGFPAMAGRALDRHSDSVVGESFDGAARNRATVADEDQGESHEYRGEVDPRGGPNVVPGEDGRVSMRWGEGERDLRTRS
jgi:hypothetical protein